MSILKIALLAVALALLLWFAAAFILVVSPAWAHMATPTAAQPQGWSYPLNCCSGQDCRRIPQSWVRATPDGWRMPNGNVVAYDDARKRLSPDGDYHWCTIGGTFEGNTICLFVPSPGV